MDQQEQAWIAFNDLQGTEIEVTAGARGTWTIGLRAGAAGIAQGGGVKIYRETCKFWLGFMKQAQDPTREDYCSVEITGKCTAELAALADYYKSPQVAHIVLREGRLAAGEELRFRVGDTTRGGPPAAVPCHAQRNCNFRIYVDRDGSGEYELLPGRLIVHVLPGPAARLSVIAPSRVQAGAPFRVIVRFEDKHCNPRAPFAGQVHLDAGPQQRAVPACCEVAPADRGIHAVEGVALLDPGVHRIRARTADGRLCGESNPIECVAEAPTHGVFWGDMHNHTLWADGTGDFDDNYAFARDEACLDICAISEHLSNREPFEVRGERRHIPAQAAWVRSQAAAARWHEPGRFVTMLGYEYTPVESRKGVGDHCVYFPRLDHELLNGDDRDELIRRLAEAGGLFVPHVGGGWSDWKYGEADPSVLCLAEIASMHEHSEWFVQEGLRHGYRLGIVGMSDGHMGKPGYDVWARHGRAHVPKRTYSVQSAITAVLARELTHEAVWEALRARRVYATTGERILLSFEMDGRMMGEEYATREAPRARIGICGTDQIARVDLIRGECRAAGWPGEGRHDLEIEWTDPAPLPGTHYYYVRVTQRNGTYAWSSPIWVIYQGPESPAADLPAWNEGVPWRAEQEGQFDYRAQLEALLEAEGAAGLFDEIRQIGVYEEHRGPFVLFHARDAKTGALVHIHYYLGFDEGRLYISRGDDDFGQESNL